MKLKSIVGHQAASVFDHSTTFVLFSLCLLSIIMSMCAFVAVCVPRDARGKPLPSDSFIFAFQRSIPRDYPTNDWPLMQHSSV